jgi:hypothetical protein
MFGSKVPVRLAVIPVILCIAAVASIIATLATQQPEPMVGVLLFGFLAYVAVDRIRTRDR